MGIGEFGVSRDGERIIKTYALGSCVAVVVYDHVRSTAGMMHVALPDSSVNADKAKQLPGYFDDIGKRNVLAIKKYLCNNRLGIGGEEGGGTISRTVSVSVDAGEVVISSKGKMWSL